MHGILFGLCAGFVFSGLSESVFAEGVAGTPLPGGGVQTAAPATGFPLMTLGSGSLHKIRLPANDPRVPSLRDKGLLRFEEDYGSFLIVGVDEADFGGRAAFLKEGFVHCDDQDIVVVNGMALNGRNPVELLERLHPDERWDAADTKSLDPDTGLYVIQFRAPIRDAWVQRLQAAGMRFSQYLSGNAYAVSFAPEDVWKLEQLRDTLPAVQYLGAYQPAYRMTPGVRKSVRSGAGFARTITIQVLRAGDTAGLLPLIEAMSKTATKSYAVGPYLNVAAEIDPVHFRELAFHSSVFAIEERGVPERFDERQGQIVAGNVTGGQLSGPDYLQWLDDLGFNNTQFGSFSINVVDDAFGLQGHPDIPNSRISFELNPTGQTGQDPGHGFLNAHIIAGFNDQTGTAWEDAGGYNYGLGIAPWARVGVSAIFGNGGIDPVQIVEGGYTAGARISSNSWGFLTKGGGPVTQYDSASQAYDFLSRDALPNQAGNQEYLVIFAAGNSGDESNTVSSPGTAKNILTVGASENVRTTGSDGCGIGNSGADNFDDMIDFSSRGPVNSIAGDGRWKPEMVAPGTHVQAGVPQSNYSGTGVCNGFWPLNQTLYGWSSGTSHATPAVAGGAALLRQYFLNEGMSEPSPAMSKAILAGTGEYMTGVGANDDLPSNSQGLGRMLLGRIFDERTKLYRDQQDLLNGTGETYEMTAQVDDNTVPLRVVLAWTDAPGSSTSTPYLNNLDLTVSMGNDTYMGNVFAGKNSVMGGSADSRNNTESVFLPVGVSGEFTVTVTAASLPGDGVPGEGDTTDQDFALYIYNATEGLPDPVEYCSGKQNSQGCTPRISYQGLASIANEAPFLIQGTDLLNERNGLLFYGMDGSAQMVFQGGTLCVAPRLVLMAPQKAGGTSLPAKDCSGTMSEDFNAHIASGMNPALRSGQRVNAQWWQRDRFSADGTGFGFSNALEFYIQ